MLHENGIEVYLKPRGENFKAWKFREVPSAHHAGDHVAAHCAVHSTTDTLAVVVKISDKFEMKNIPALNITVAVEGPADRQNRTWTASREELQSAGHYVIHSWDNPISFRGYRTIPGQGQRRQVLEPPDNLTVDLSATADRSHNAPDNEDLVYTFKFQTLPKATYKKQAKKYNASIPPSVSSKVQWFTPDPDFERDLKLKSKHRTGLSSHSERSARRPRAQLTGAVLRPQVEVCYCGQDKTSRRQRKSKNSSQTHAKPSSSNTASVANKDSETVASSCGICQKLKPAPRGKKLAYRGDRGQWMVVATSAPDEDDPQLQITLDTPEASEAGTMPVTAASETVQEAASDLVQPDRNIMNQSPASQHAGGSPATPGMATTAIETLPTVLDAQKRTTTPLAESHPTKKQRIDVDLTSDDNDNDENNTVVVKQEHTKDTNFNTEETNLDEDQDEIEANLKAIRLRLEENQLKQKEIELELKLKRKLKLKPVQNQPQAHSGARMKVEHIED